MTGRPVTLPLAVLNEPATERVRELKGLAPGTLLVHEVYASVQGEGTQTGRPCAFVRLTGCHMRCRYCDTEHAFHGGAERRVAEVAAEVVGLGLPLVLLTGGEPLLQRAAPDLLAAFADAGLTVLLETSGGVSTRAVDARVRIILDVKTPGSGESDRNLEENLERLREHDEVKYVLTSEDDYRWARDHAAQHGLAARCEVLFSAAAGALDPRWIAERVVAERLPVRVQVQLHKLLWGDRQGV